MKDWNSSVYKPPNRRLVYRAKKLLVELKTPAIDQLTMSFHGNDQVRMAAANPRSLHVSYAGFIIKA